MPFSASPDSDANKNMKNMDDFWFEKSSSSKKLSTETLIKELYYVVTEKNEFQQSAKSNFKIK